MQTAAISRGTGGAAKGFATRIEMALAVAVAVVGLGAGALIAAPAGGTDAVRSGVAIDAPSVPLAERVPGPGASEGKAP